MCAKNMTDTYIHMACWEEVCYCIKDLWTYDIHNKTEDQKIIEICPIFKHI